jgi:hypothetical protein
LANLPYLLPDTCISSISWRLLWNRYVQFIYCSFMLPPELGCLVLIPAGTLLLAGVL